MDVSEKKMALDDGIPHMGERRPALSPFFGGCRMLTLQYLPEEGSAMEFGAGRAV
ncbi:hypothetical protein [Nitrospirillum sp. BR 11828]|uniref:hypothetical protein n=1 Tax=Nitrospirillum sp. BR 11828 TaxID=3104325 RepID=UPI002ACAABEE|nr:hypothetical protein [Nitrospirillum sp. BR 11828]MDZ5646087.1 hypothetical protein [Nitrospirillum sp. BR 11828]